MKNKNTKAEWVNALGTWVIGIGTIMIGCAALFQIPDAANKYKEGALQNLRAADLEKINLVSKVKEAAAILGEGEKIPETRRVEARVTLNALEPFFRSQVADTNALQMLATESQNIISSQKPTSPDTIEKIKKSLNEINALSAPVFMKTETITKK